MGNETKTCFLGKANAAPFCPAEVCSAVEDSVENGLQVVWRIGDGTQHGRDGRPLPKDLGLLFLANLKGRERLRALRRFRAVVHRSSFPIYVAGEDGIAPAATLIAPVAT
jgi:hypothetical protein